MSPRAACRLETLGFSDVYDYVGGKAERLAYGLPREGENAGAPYAGELADLDPPTCALRDTVADVRAALDGSRYGFCLVLSERRILLGRVRRTAMDGADATAPVESLMEPDRAPFASTPARASSCSASPASTSRPPSSRRPAAAWSGSF